MCMSPAWALLQPSTAMTTEEVLEVVEMVEVVASCCLQLWEGKRSNRNTYRRALPLEDATVTVMGC